MAAGESGAGGLGRPGADRRIGRDRRGRPTPPWAAWLGHRRRRAGRRRDDRAGAYVDVYAPSDVLLLTAIFLLNVLDAGFTLSHLSHGARELNPVMAWMLALGDGSFLFTKCFAVGAWLVFLLVHKNFRLVKAGLIATLALYAGVLAWHLLLQLGRSPLATPS
jgi:Domain of unknown function (DUF5658)